MSSTVVRRLGVVIGAAAGLWLVRQLLFSAQTSDLEGAPFQALVLVAGWSSVLGLGVALALEARASTALSAAVWRGASDNAVVVIWASFALAVASYCGFVDLQDVVDAVREPRDVADTWRPYAVAAIAVMAIGPMLVSTFAVLAIATWQFQRLRRDESPRRAVALWVFLVPWILGGVAETGFRAAEQAVLERFVDEPTSADPTTLEVWRGPAWLHAWPRLWEATDHDASSTAPLPDGRARRARAAFEALTGFDFFADSRAGH
jgi:hypothetical protein